MRPRLDAADNPTESRNTERGSATMAKTKTKTKAKPPRTRATVPKTTRVPARAKGAAAVPATHRPAARGPSARLWVGLALGLAVVLAGALIAASQLAGSEEESAAPVASAPSTAVAGAEEIELLLEGIPQDGTALGSPDAPVTLVEFADVQCVYCAQWARDAFPTLVHEYVRDGRLRIVYRPMAFLGPDSDRAAAAVIAAGEQQKLWNVLELLFASQGGENSGWVTDEIVEGIAGSVKGLDAERLLADAERPLVAEERGRVDAEARSEGITGTPSFLLGPTGGKLERLEVKSLGPEAFRGPIDELLGS